MGVVTPPTARSSFSPALAHRVSGRRVVRVMTPPCVASVKNVGEFIKKLMLPVRRNHVPAGAFRVFQTENSNGRQSSGADRESHVPF